MDRHAVSALVRPPPPIPGSTLPNPELLPGRAARSKNLGDQAQIWCSAWARKSQTAEVRCQSALETLHVLEDLFLPISHPISPRHTEEASLPAPDNRHLPQSMTVERKASGGTFLVHSAVTLLGQRNKTQN